MAELNPAAGGDEQATVPWKVRVEEPINRFIHYPIARWMVGWLRRTPVTPNQITLVQLPLAIVAAWLIAVGGPLYTILGILVFGFRSLLDCVDGTLARAKNMSSPQGHALDALMDWLSCTVLYLGVYAHFRLHPPPPGSWSSYLSMGWIVAFALGAGGLRSFASDYYKQRLSAIFDRGKDESQEFFQERLGALKTDRSAGTVAEAWIVWMGHLVFELNRSRPLDGAGVAALQQARDEPLTRFVAGMWSVSNGDFWITISLAGALLGVLWPTVLFLATAGYVWIALSVLFTNWFIRRTVGRGELVTA